MSSDSEQDEAAGKPKVPGKEALRTPLPKRFYKSVTTAAAPGGGYVAMLDGYTMQTPAKRAFAVPSTGLAEAIADEWRAQGSEIDPTTMPLTRISNSAIDAVAAQAGAVRADLVAYAASDLLCYRAAAPEGLTLRQLAAWAPVVNWIEQQIGARFVLAEGVIPVEQPPRTLEKFADFLGEPCPFRLSALHVITSLTGSALLAVAHDRGAVAADATWAAAHIDEDWQIEMWGIDSEAEARRRYRTGEFMAASRMLALLPRN